MKNKLHVLLRRLGYVLLIFCGMGLVLALIGLVFKDDSMYFLGLALSSPLFIIVLPFCLLVFALMGLGSFYKVFSDLYSVFCIHHQSGSKTHEEIAEKSETE